MVNDHKNTRPTVVGFPACRVTRAATSRLAPFPARYSWSRDDHRRNPMGGAPARLYADGCPTHPAALRARCPVCATMFRPGAGYPPIASRRTGRPNLHSDPRRVKARLEVHLRSAAEPGPALKDWPRKVMQPQSTLRRCSLARHWRVRQLHCNRAVVAGCFVGQTDGVAPTQYPPDFGAGARVAVGSRCTRKRLPETGSRTTVTAHGVSATVASAACASGDPPRNARTAFRPTGERP